MAMRRDFPSWLPVVDKLRTLTELDPETAELLPLRISGWGTILGLCPPSPDSLPGLPDKGWQQKLHEEREGLIR
jgi:hypothetical protein